MKILLLLLLVAGGIDVAYACSCSPPPPPAEKRDRAVAVFVGTVVAKDESDGRRIFDFAVQEVFKGDLKQRVVITSAKEESLCGVNFAEKKRYLVYASGPIGGLSTSLCAANKDAGSDEGREEIETLRKIPAKQPNQPQP